MIRFLLLLAFPLLFVQLLSAQVEQDSVLPVTDTLRRTDTLINEPAFVWRTIDSFSKKPIENRTWQLAPGTALSIHELSRQVLEHHPWLGFNTASVKVSSQLMQFKGKEFIFYFLIGLLLVYALLRNAFPKYFNDLFRLFFRTTIKQRQIREQLVQTPLPSLMLNGFFVISAGLYLTFVLEYFHLNPVNNFWLLFLYCVVGLSVIYFVKFLGLKISGWLFSMKEAADSYIFIVFVVNKMLGILLLPFLVLLAFSEGSIHGVAVTLSWFVIAGLLIYRFILTYSAIRNQVRVNPFHFFLYLLAFEIAPLLLVYKGLLPILRISP